MKTTNTKKTHTWKTQSGLTVIATAELLLTESSISADGWETTATETAAFTTFSIRVDGKLIDSYLEETPRVVGGVSYAANYGPLVISHENLAVIKSIIAETENHPAIIAKNKAFDASLKADREYAEHTAKIKKAMGE